MKFEIAPHKRTKKCNQNEWFISIKPYGKVNKALVIKQILKLEPTLKITKVRTIKSIDKCLISITSDKKPVWAW